MFGKFYFLEWQQNSVQVHEQINRNSIHKLKLSFNVKCMGTKMRLMYQSSLAVFLNHLYLSAVIMFGIDFLKNGFETKYFSMEWSRDNFIRWDNKKFNVDRQTYKHMWAHTQREYLVGGILIIQRRCMYMVCFFWNSDIALPDSNSMDLFRQPQ